MVRQILIGVAVIVLVSALSGCGFLIGKLPHVKIEPPAPQQTQQKTAESPTTPPAEPQAKTNPEPAPTETVIQGKLPTPAGGGSSSGGVRYVPVGAQRTLTTSDLSGLSKWQIDVLRNEIYAAHGRTFDRSDLQSYFDRQTWYSRNSGFSESQLSSLEKRNAAFIAEYQRGRGQTGGSASSGNRRRSGGGSQWVSTGFVLPFSSDRQVTSADLQGLDRWQLDVARNEIYARHGRPFQRADLRNYFRGQAWYSEDDGYRDSRLSRLEARNAEFIRQHQ